MAASLVLGVLFVIGVLFWPLEIWVGALIVVLGACALALGVAATAVVGFVLGGVLLFLGLRRAWRSLDDRETMFAAIGLSAERHLR